MKKSTIKDISKVSGFSNSTVSKALNNSKEISKRTRDKIKNIANNLNYKPNFFASRLRKNVVNNIGIIVPDILNYYFAKVIKGVQLELYKSGYNLTCFFSDESPAIEKKIIKKLRDGSVAGLLISLAKDIHDENTVKNLKDLQSYDIPIVMFDRISNEFDCDKVYMDNFKATFDSINHLCKKGKNKIAFLSPIHDTLIGKERYNGYVEALKSNKINYKSELYIPYNKEDDIESEIIKLTSDNKIDAIICMEPENTVSTHSLILNLGYKIPNDIAVLGFTDGPMYKFIKPSITSVNQHGEYLGKYSAKILLDRINNKLGENFIDEKVPTSLIIRDST
jgi:LacI family transcriptional regulator